jgi:hypothetical protein
MRGES